ncbi:hypothetical protein [Salirhabdus sp. Marseille-P4669]|uniref:hypothetical protein n=1 Tax=Salirhabdus sp. Marseille-P4669 TaxID=2042310 RepID=UPI001356B3A7|nr:hypothetical protein [Salirhabdus sp. Marseille-P4669]
MLYIPFLSGIIAGILTLFFTTDQTPILITNILLGVIIGLMINKEKVQNPKK